MAGFRPVAMLCSAGLGALMAVAGPQVGIMAQELAQELRPSLDGAPDALQRDISRSGANRSRGAGAQRAPAAPTYGNPPGFGAGRSGFVSTNPRPRPRTNATSAAPGRGQLQPLRLSPQTPAPSAAPNTAQASPADVRSGDLPVRPRPRLEPPPVDAPDIRGPVRRRAPQEADPFAAPGISAGSFTLRPAIEVMGGYDTNAPRVSPARGSSVLIVSPELLARSNWSRHELSADLRGSYTAYGQTPDENRPGLNAIVRGRVDVTRQTNIDLETRAIISTDRPGSPDIPLNLSRLPIATTLGGTAGFAHRFNRIEVSLKGSVDRTTYEDSVFVDGSTASNQDRNFNQYATQLRASYELSPGMKPFVELGVDTRIRDLEIDVFGIRRDSDGRTAKAGLTFEASPKLTGQISAGYLVRTYKDPSLPELRGVIADASLIWAATALTTIKLTATSTADESTVPGVSGVLRRDAVLQADHAFRRWLISSAKLGYGTDTYEGSTREDTRYFASLGLTYKLTRTTQVKGELRQEWLKSNVPGNDYTATVALVGLRFQR